MSGHMSLRHLRPRLGDGKPAVARLRCYAVLALFSRCYGLVVLQKCCRRLEILRVQQDSIEAVVDDELFEVFVPSCAHLPHEWAGEVLVV